MFNIKNMHLIDRKIKFWILITLIALLFWAISWTPAIIDRFYGIHGTHWNVLIPIVGWMIFIVETSGAFGMIFRLIGITLAISSLLLLIYKHKKLGEIKNWITSALIMESLYYFLLLPATLFILGVGNTPFTEELRLNTMSMSLGVEYLLLVLFSAPFLLILAIKIYKSNLETNSFQSWKWVSITVVGYVASLWMNALVSSYTKIGVEFGIILNGFGVMQVIFGLIGASFLVKKNFSSTFKWIGLTFVTVGSYYLVYSINLIITNNQASLNLAEIWTIPLIGLGLTLLQNSRKSTRSRIISNL